MLLYWGMFTVGFTVGTIFAFITFVAKNPEDEIDTVADELTSSRALWGKSQAHEFLADNTNRSQSSQVAQVDDKGFAVN